MTRTTSNIQEELTRHQVDAEDTEIRPDIREISATLAVACATELLASIMQDVKQNDY